MESTKKISEIQKVRPVHRKDGTESENLYHPIHDSNKENQEKNDQEHHHGNDPDLGHIIDVDA